MASLFIQLLGRPGGLCEDPQCRFVLYSYQMVYGALSTELGCSPSLGAELPILPARNNDPKVYVHANYVHTSNSWEEISGIVGCSNASVYAKSLAGNMSLYEGESVNRSQIEV
jgi:hypothetical protein